MARMLRASFFIDGFNLYHALKRLDGQHLKWVDLAKLMRRQIAPQSEMIADIFYFSAYAHWLPQQRARHEQYVAALRATGITVILGQFKDKPRSCQACGARWTQHEEKETDVNLALYLVNEAYRDSYDRAYLVSRDSDLRPAVAMVRGLFPAKEVYIVAPPELGHSNDLINVATGKRKILRRQIEDCLFPEFVRDGGGTVVAHRPGKYAPPR